MKIATSALFLAASVTALAQQYETTRARITGGGGNGKCSFEVLVDGTVEIEVLGDQARMRSLAGANGQWRKMECNQALPANPAQFGFNPTGGRGKQSLTTNPNDNRGVAVVRIEDSQGGSDTYKFDMTWNGSTGPQSGRNVPGRNGNPGTGGSIFDQGNNNGFPQNNNGGGFPNNNSNNNGSIFNGGGNSNDPVNYQAPGDGYLRRFNNGSDDQLSDGQVNVDRNGRVTVILNSRNNGRIQLNGTVILNNGDRLVANVSGGTMQGAMEILLDTRNRVQELAMTGVGRNRFELRWQPR